MHAIRAFIRSHLYAAHATSRATPAAPRPATPSIAAGPNSAARRRRARAFTRALVDTLRSFDPRHHGARSEWPAPVPG